MWKSRYSIQQRGTMYPLTHPLLKTTPLSKIISLKRNESEVCSAVETEGSPQVTDGESQGKAA